MRNLLAILTLALLFASGCAPTAPKAPPTPPPVFDFAPPATAAPNSAGVTLALVNPSYSETNPDKSAIFAYYPFVDFQRNMGRDFEEMLVARGFSVTGPFRSWDDMTFPDKNGCDLILRPSLDVSVDFPGLQAQEVIMLIGDNQYKVVGQVAVRGRVTLALTESLSGEKMWSKSVDIPAASQVANFTGEKRYPSPPNGADPSDLGLQKVLGPMMSSAYGAMMDAAWRHFDPAEIQIVKREAQIVKDKKRY